MYDIILLGISIAESENTDRLRNNLETSLALEITKQGGIKYMSNNSSSDLMSGLFTGLIIGIGLGLLYAPRSGHELRDDLKHRTAEIRARAEELGDHLIDRAEEIGDDVRHHIKRPSLKVNDTAC